MKREHNESLDPKREVSALLNSFFCGKFSFASCRFRAALTLPFSFWTTLVFELDRKCFFRQVISLAKLFKQL